MNQNEILTVSQVNKIIKDTIEANPFLSHISVEGEISNFKRNASGHLYFTLKDESSQISCIMWRSSTLYLNFEPKNGDKVTVSGSIQTYQTGGTYQILVNRMREAGIGILYQKYEELKKKLEAKGYFDSRRKRPLPEYPKNIALLTSDTGAVIEDLKHVILNRSQFSNLILYPTKVQGDGAKELIVRNIKLANENPIIDVIILARGGGSIEDLWNFNEEELARRIFDCKVPTISAVGHEIDYTIADFVADMRAPTPTGAAEMAVPNMPDLTNHINNLKVRLNEAITGKINYQKLYLDSIKNSFVIKNPMLLFEPKKQQLDLIIERLNKVILSSLDNAKHRLEIIKTNHIIKNPTVLYKDKRIYLNNLIEKVKLLNPLNSLDRGFSVTYKDDKLVSSIKNVQVKDEVLIRLKDGTLKADVKEIRKEE